MASFLGYQLTSNYSMCLCHGTHDYCIYLQMSILCVQFFPKDKNPGMLGWRPRPLISLYCQNPNSTSTKEQFNKSWVWLENDFAHHPPHHHTNSMSVISQLLLTRFWWNFKRRFMGLSWTDFNCCSNICPGNICQGDICPHKLNVCNISAVINPI